MAALRAAVGICGVRVKHTFLHYGAERSGGGKNSVFYSAAPFLGAAFGMIIFGEGPGVRFWVALVIMLVSTYFMARDTLEPKRKDRNS